MAVVNTTTAGYYGGGGTQPRMVKELMKAATSGDFTSMQAMASRDQSILHGTTPSGNTCLHISSIHGHVRFCEVVAELKQGLLEAVNMEGETPLVVAVTNGHVSLAFVLLGLCYRLRLRQAILQQDMHGCNALHHAICFDHKELALELIRADPDLSAALTRFNMSAMFAAAVRDYRHVIKKLLNTQGSSHAGMLGRNALHAAVIHGHAESARIIMGIRPEMVKATDEKKNSPVRLAVRFNNTEVLRVLLEHDHSLGYELSEDDDSPLLVSAAFGGHIDIAQEILNHCPDAPYRLAQGWTCLHTAVFRENAEFVKFILGTPQLEKLINMQHEDGKTALHLAVQKCNPTIVSILLSHRDIDVTVQDHAGNSAAWELWSTTDCAKTLNWNEVLMRMVEAYPQGDTSLYNLQMEAKQKATMKSRKDAKSLTQIYTTNTSLVAILITTITFAAAFTLPGGYSSAPESEGLSIMARKVSFNAFLISNTLAMCSSFAVAFICMMARWEDYEFLIYYVSFTKKLMWFAYATTTTSFSTGLYTVLAPRLNWMAIAICVLVALLPFITWLLGKWPVLKLRFRLGKSFRSDLLNMV